jgi:16S rRNA (guanine527-N7)-methyltransferase
VLIVPDLSPELRAFSLNFMDLLEKWNRRYSLTALPPADREEELILDSSVLVPWVQNLAPGSRVVDLGTGMGIPALVIAASRADIQVVAVDKVARKLAFVRQAALELGLENLQTRSGRIEDLAPLQADLGVAKAVGPLSQLLRWWERHGSPAARFLALKGPGWRDELPVPGWRFDAHPYQLPSRGGRVVVEAWRPDGR